MFKIINLKLFMALLTFISFATWFSPVSTHAATPGPSIILVLDGIKGESRDQRVKDGIDVYSFSFGATNPVISGPLNNGRQGKPTFSDFSFMKSFDTASLPLLKNLATAHSIASGTLYFFNNSNTPYLTIKLKNIMVTSVQYSGAETEKITESLSLNAADIQFEYIALREDGRPGSKQTLDIDVNKGTAN
ncbi:Hcp family type VI secretion system effector [Paenibacillus sp. GCM10027628]|uniref:Hcp family type VI secretion system effector n=1 Tax=Paenibacillus sp. GCM10027628 TaxID=3273413 RepID=UPI0036291D15